MRETSGKFGVESSGGRSPEDETLLDAATLQAVEDAAAVLRKRWKPGILWLLAAGHHRYTALLRRLPGISPKVLTQQLRELERDGIVVRTVHTPGPRHVEYALSPAGQVLRPLVDALATSGRRYVEMQRGEPRRAAALDRDRGLGRARELAAAPSPNPPGRAATEGAYDERSARERPGPRVWDERRAGR